MGWSEVTLRSELYSSLTHMSTENAFPSMNRAHGILQTKEYDLRGSTCESPKTEHNEGTFISTKGENNCGIFMLSDFSCI